MGDCTNDAQQKCCDHCWEFPQLLHIKKVKVQNKKYCWLYPEREKKILKKLKPNFDHCKTLYTKCDYRLEACVQEQILKVEDELRTHNELMKKQLESQNKIIDRMWVLSQRYLFLTSHGVCVKMYPEIISIPTEQRIACEFQKLLKKLYESNCRLGESLEHIRTSLKELNHRCSQLDMTVESYFIVGNWYQRPLHHIRKIIDDLFKYFYGVLCKLKTWAQLLEINNSVAIEDYMALVKPSDDFQDYLMTGMEQCKCLRTNKQECIREHVPC